MQINWSELVTNILGFLILFWGLRKWMWGPLLAHLDARKVRIEGDFEKISQGVSDNEALRGDLESQLREVDATARKKIEEAAAEGNRLAAAIKDEARDEARSVLDKARTDIDHERDKASVALRNDIVKLAVGGAEKILREKLDAKGQAELVNRFIDEHGGSNA